MPFPEDYEWRSKSPADVAFAVFREGSELILESPSCNFWHHYEGFSKLQISLPRNIPIEFRYEETHDKLQRRVMDRTGQTK